MHNPLIVLALLVAGTCVFLYHPRFFTRPVSGGRRFVLALLQLIPLLLLCWLLTNPQAEKRIREDVETTAILLIDDSPSMGYSDGLTGEARLKVSEQWVDEVVAQHKENPPAGGFKKAFLSSLLQKGRSGSDFAEGFKELVRRSPEASLAAIVFISDGRDRSIQSPLEIVETLNFPVHTVGVGPDTAPDSIRVSWEEAPTQALPGTPFLVRWAIDSCLEDPLSVTAIVQFASREIWSGEMTLPHGPSRQEDWISVSGQEMGEKNLQIRIEAPERPSPFAIAEATVTIEENPRSLLILETYPSRNVRSLTQAALASGRYRVLRPVALPGGGGVIWDLFRPFQDRQADPEPPWTQENRVRKTAQEWESALSEILPEVSAVVLGDRPWKGIPDRWATDLSEEIARNRLGILALPGSETGRESLQESRLRRLLDWVSAREDTGQPIRLKFPEEARSHPALAPVWSYLDLVGEIGADRFFPVQPTASQVLLPESGDRALVLQTRFDLGQAILVSLSNLWELRSYSSKNVDAKLEEGLWLGFLDSLSGTESTDSPTLTLEPSRPSAGQPFRIRVHDPSLQPGPPVAGLRIREKGGEWRNLLISPDPEWRGIGESTWVPRGTGVYELGRHEGGPTVEVEVTDRPAESGEETRDSAFLEDLADRGGGEYRDFKEREEVLAGIEFPIRTQSRLSREPLSHSAGLGIAVAILFCCGWGLRRILSLP